MVEECEDLPEQRCAVADKMQKGVEQVYSVSCLGVNVMEQGNFGQNQRLGGTSYEASAQVHVPSRS